MASWRWLLVLLVWVGLAGPPPLRAQAGPPVPMPKELPLEVAVADVQPEGALASTSLAPASLAPAPGEAARPPALTYPLKRFAASMDPWGWRYSQRRGAWRMHTGVDLAADEGTPVLAASAGRVLLVESISGYGTTVLLDHGAGWQTLYAHLRSTSVATGQRLSQGEVLGEVTTKLHVDIYKIIKYSISKSILLFMLFLLSITYPPLNIYSILFYLLINSIHPPLKN